MLQGIHFWKNIKYRYFYYTLFSLFVLTTAITPTLNATPLIALKEADNCAGCHTPGRSQLPVTKRRCTLDCQGCHVDPNGGGARNEWGYYYSHDQMALINLLKPTDPLLQDKTISLHYDMKALWYKYGETSKQQIPMYQETTIRLRPFYQYLHLNLIYSWLHLGRHGDRLYRLGSEGNIRNREKFSIMFDALPFNSFIRYYRGTPTYGIKRTNHTQWIRENIGLSQYAITEAYEFGTTPNVPFFRLSLLKGNPYLKESEKQKGYSYHGGVRGVSFAWHLNTSGWKTKNDFHEIDMKAYGAGFKLLDFIFYGEKNIRKVSPLSQTSQSQPSGIHPSSTITELTLSYAAITGIMPGMVLETMNYDGKSSQRRSFFIDFHPIPFLQFEIWQRQQTGARNIKDTIGVLHAFFDI